MATGVARGQRIPPALIGVGYGIASSFWSCSNIAGHLLDELRQIFIHIANGVCPSGSCE